MSKELEAFMDILGILSAVTGCDVDADSEHIKIVKQALQRLESIDNAEPSEALKTLEVLNKIISPLLEPVLAEYKDDLGDKITANYFALKQSLLKAEKELKALEIIKKKSVWVGRLKSLFRKYNNNLDVLRFYNANMWVDYQITKEEFNLLKEVLE